MLEVKKVTKNVLHHSENVLLQDVSFTVQREEWISIIGPSGAGKTTLLNCKRQIVPTF